MYIPFLVVIIAAGAPVALTVLLLAYASNLNASLTHYGTTPAPIWFGAGYVKQRDVVVDRFRCFSCQSAHLDVLGSLWWKALRWW